MLLDKGQITVCRTGEASAGMRCLEEFFAGMQIIILIEHGALPRSMEMICFAPDAPAHGLACHKWRRAYLFASE
jgi:hypothetical protein